MFSLFINKADDYYVSRLSYLFIKAEYKLFSFLFKNKGKFKNLLYLSINITKY